MHSLKLLHALVTRPGEKGLALCELIRKAGGKAVHYPTIAFAAPQDEIACQHAIQHMGTADWWIFVSPQAVAAAAAAIKAAWPHFSGRLAAIGAGTAQAIADAGLSCPFPTLYPSRAWHSEGLLALPEFQSLALQTVAIIRGEGGRDHLEKSLIEAGARVMPVIAYRRVLPDLLPPLIFDEINLVIVTSGEALANLSQLVQHAAWQHFKNRPLLVVSERIKKLAQDLAFQTIWVADQPTHNAILKMIQLKSKRRGYIFKSEKKERKEKKCKIIPNKI